MKNLTLFIRKLTDKEFEEYKQFLINKGDKLVSFRKEECYMISTPVDAEKDEPDQCRMLEYKIDAKTPLDIIIRNIKKDMAEL